MPTATPLPRQPAPAGTVCIVGTGALGGLLGARLALAGQAVQMVGRPAQVQALQAHGLRLHDAQGTRTVALPASTCIAAVGQVANPALVVLCVKSADTAAAAQQLLPHLRALPPGVPVLSLQNGVANAPLLAGLLQRPVLAGVAYVAAAAPAPGEVRHHGGQRLVLGVVGPAAAGPGPVNDAGLPRVQQRLQAAGFEVQATATPLAELWRKLVVNCACNAISALAQASYAQMAAVPAVRALQAAVVEEAVAVARAEGHALDAAELLAAVQAIAQQMPAQRSSTAQDLARGRATEIEHLNGEVLRAGVRHGIATPANQALVALVQLHEAMAAGGGAAPSGA